MRTTFPLRVAAVGLFLGGFLTGCATQHDAAGPSRQTSPQQTSPQQTSTEQTSTRRTLPPFVFTADAGNPAVYRSHGAELLADGSPVLPLDGYDVFAQGADSTEVADALNAIEQNCTRGAGVHLPAGFADADLPSPVPTLAYYGVTTRAQARVDGYRLVSRDDHQAGGSMDPTAAPKLSANAAGVVSGCVRTADTLLGMQSSYDAFGFVQELRGQALTATMADPVLQAADARWSACMSDAGYDYADPLEPGHDTSMLGRGLPVPKGATLPPVSPYERTVAETDVSCKERTDYLQTYVNVAAGHQDRLIAANQAQLQQVLQQWQSLLSAAARAVAANRQQ